MARGHDAASHVVRHIQDMDAAESTVPHWGYADRVVPCTNDPGSCAYLDVVYEAHDVGMVYTGIIWLTILAVVFAWAILRRAGRPGGPEIRDTTTTTLTDHERQTSAVRRAGGLRRGLQTFTVALRRRLLPDAPHAIFGRSTRFQVAVLAALAAYLTIFTFVGITYNTWVTPVSDMPGVNNTRTSLGPWSDRIGVIAYALTPLSVLLASRESVLSLLLGVPYQSLNFLHRWTGYIIFVQSSLHTIGWCVIQMRLYRPQPSVGLEWIVEPYMIWGLVAMILLTVLFILSTPWGIRMTGYETFRKAHYVLAMVYIGACWGHWEQLKCFLEPALLFWFLDRIARLIRTALLHYNRLPSGHMGFRSSPAAVTVFPDAENGDVVRLELENDQDAWSVGRHFYLCFTECSIWQSHPFTPLNAPVVRDGRVKHSYVLRAKAGETRKVAEMAKAKLGAVQEGGKEGDRDPVTTPVILTGPYGEKATRDVRSSTNVVCVAGGTGVTFVLPVLQELARQPISAQRVVEFIWVVRHARDVAWIQPELEELHKAQRALKLKIRLFATRDVGSGREREAAGDEKGGDLEAEVKAVDDAPDQTPPPLSSVASSSDPDPDAICPCDGEIPVRKTGQAVLGVDRHPDLDKLLRDFVGATTSGPTMVFASGPGGMISDVRSTVASCNSGSKVWAGEERADVRLVCDNRLEW